jgi:hypothetical protein
VTVFGPRSTFLKLNNDPVKVGEVEKLLEPCDDAVARAFLLLVRDAVRARGSAEAEENVRTALQALSEAMRCLPVVNIEPIDTRALRDEAEALVRRAREEPDAVTADAQDRRAKALLIRAQTHDQSTLTVKRCDALRSEIQAEIEAVHEGLAAHQLPASATSLLATLALAARQVAADAAEFSSARAELDLELSSVGRIEPPGPRGCPPERQEGTEENSEGEVLLGRSRHQ